MEDSKELTKEELFKEIQRLNNNINAEKLNKKNDPELKELKDNIKKFKDNNTPKEVKQMKAQIKDLLKEAFAPIAEDIEEKKILEKEYNKSIKQFKEERNKLLALLAQKLR